jgi:DNA-directed RNA polymerase subunit RPC12/RpoP
MTKYLCKDCWLEHDLDTLLARCDECKKRAFDRPEPLLSRRDPDAPDGLLVCRHHKDEALKILCNECKEPVPAGTFGNRSVLAVVGDTASGKTTLMWAVIARPHRARSNGGLSIQRSIGKSDQQLDESVAPIFTTGQAQTKKSDATIRNYAWELKLPNGAHGNWLLAFHDAAGEIWRDLADLNSDTHPALRRFLKRVGSVMFTIDGEKLLDFLDLDVNTLRGAALRSAEEYELRIAEALGQRFMTRGDKMPIAVTVTKADVLWDREEWALFRPDSGATRERIDRAVQQLLDRTGRRPLLDMLATWFSPVSFFAVSAFGCKPSPGIRVEDVRSSRVEEPIGALLNL